jgi:hypothetical protein
MSGNPQSLVKKINYVVGTRPKHVHHGPVSGDWECNSPYCEDMLTDKPEDGGPDVIVIGREPWRGR